MLNVKFILFIIIILHNKKLIKIMTLFGDDSIIFKTKFTYCWTDFVVITLNYLQIVRNNSIIIYYYITIYNP